MIYDRAMTALVHYFLLGGVAIGEAGLLVLFWWSFHCCYKELITVAELFFFVILLLLFCMCVSVMPLGCCVVAGWV
jgi:hypothetical protein